MTNKSNNINGIIKALNKGDKDALIKAIESGEDVNGLNEYGDPVIFQSLLEPDLLEVLIQAGADVNVFDNEGDSPLKNAVENLDTFYYELFDRTYSLLIEHGADVNAKIGESKTPLLYSFIDNPEIVKRLIKDGADIDFLDPYDDPILHSARHSPKVIKLLIETGADIDSKNTDDLTLLENIVIESNHLYSDRKAVETLLALGAQVSLSTDFEDEAQESMIRKSLWLGNSKLVLQMHEKGFNYLDLKSEAFNIIREPELVDTLVQIGLKVEPYNIYYFLEPYNRPGPPPWRLEEQTINVPMIKSLVKADEGRCLDASEFKQTYDGSIEVFLWERLARLGAIDKSIDISKYDLVSPHYENGGTFFHTFKKETDPDLEGFTVIFNEALKQNPDILNVKNDAGITVEQHLASTLSPQHFTKAVEARLNFTANDGSSLDDELEPPERRERGLSRRL